MNFRLIRLVFKLDEKIYFDRAGQFYLQHKIIVHASLINDRLMEELIYDVTKSANNDAF